MGTAMRLAGILGLCLLVPAAAGCASQAAAPQAPRPAYPAQYPRAEADATFADLLQRVKAGATSVDFTLLRLTYADSSRYTPSTQCGDRRAMFQALHEKRVSDALPMAQAILTACPLDLDAHLASAVSLAEMGQPDPAGTHRRFIDGLVRSILDSGDGQSLKTAMTVIDVQEEYVAVNALGFRVTGQGLLHQSGRFYDELQVTDPRTGKASTLYFDITRPMRWANRQLGK